MSHRHDVADFGAYFSVAQIAELVGAPPPTAEQRAIIEAPMEPMVVVAGAGSGKTETIAARVVWLVANDYVLPSQILGLTFTRKAAGELSHRIKSRLRSFVRQAGASRMTAAGGTTRADSSTRGEGDDLGQPTVLTYAAYAGGLVAEHGLRVGLEPGSQLLSAAGRWQLGWDVVSRFDGLLDCDIGVPRSVTQYVLSLADEMANHLLDPQDLIDFTSRLLAQIDAIGPPAAYPAVVPDFYRRAKDRVDLVELVRRFEALKAERHAVDFADRMRSAAELAGLAGVQQAERDKYRVVLLDEYQDTSHSETVLLSALFGDGRAVTGVGDPLQAIYGWRGASASNMADFADRFPTSSGLPAQQFGLMTSWRNDRRILLAANRIAEPIRGGVSAEPGGSRAAAGFAELAARPDARPGQVRVIFAETTAAEADWIADRLSQEWHSRTEWGAGGRTVAVLVRQRAHIPALVRALLARDLPVEVLNIGGLLVLPEVVEVISTLKVLTDVRAAGALTRLLTGARWRIGLADLAALSERARELARAQQDVAADGEPVGRPEVHLIEGLDSLGAAGRYSGTGHRRMQLLAAELRALRRRLNQPLPDLIEDIARTSGLDAELALRGGHGRANLDRLIELAAQYSIDSTSSVPAFLAYLDVARSEDRGLEMAEATVRADCIQVLTIHGAKGLEWDVVAVAGLADKSFPAVSKGDSWIRGRGRLPFALRGDARGLPEFQLTGASTPADVSRRLRDFADGLSKHRLAEERRLAYVAMTRPRRALYCSGAAWAGGVTVKAPSPFLVELRELDQQPSSADGALTSPVIVDAWHEPQQGDTNPMTAQIISQGWPADPLGDRRERYLIAAEGVRDLLTARGARGVSETPAGPVPSRESPWRRQVDQLLAERAARMAPGPFTVEMPAELTSSAAVSLAGNPQAYARRLRRPMPAAPSPAARLGNSFHEWLEQRFQSEALLDLDELTGAVDDQLAESTLTALQAAFERGEWADRTPHAVEVPFEIALGTTLLRGRMDAVFTEPDGRFVVIDWKTGVPPTGRAAQATAVQLAVYRLAWAQLAGVGEHELHRVQAGFYYVTANRTVYPPSLLDAAGLHRLVSIGRWETGSLLKPTGDNVPVRDARPSG